MDFKEDKNCVWVEDESGRRIAWVEFPDVDEKTVDVQHTVVDPSLQGLGVAGKLMEALSDKLRCEGRRAKLTCSYAVKWFGKHPDHSDLLVN